jgi:hypothetical protein
MFERSTKNFSALWAAFLFLTTIGSQSVEASQDLTLAWNPSPSTSIAGYSIYYGNDGTNFQYVLDVGTNTSYEVSGLQEGQTYTFAVTACTSQGLGSPPSNLITYTVPGMVEITLGINFTATNALAEQTNLVTGSSQTDERTASHVSNLISKNLSGIANTAYTVSPGGPSAIGGPVITFQIAPGNTYQLQASADLLTWSTIWQTNSTGNGWAQVQDMQAANFNLRFYRVVCQ